jgi:hypothetical protein
MISKLFFWLPRMAKPWSIWSCSFWRRLDSICARLLARAKRDRVLGEGLALAPAFFCKSKIGYAKQPTQ